MLEHSRHVIYLHQMTQVVKSERGQISTFSECSFYELAIHFDSVLKRLFKRVGACKALFILKSTKRLTNVKGWMHINIFVKDQHNVDNWINFQNAQSLEIGIVVHQFQSMSYCTYMLPLCIWRGPKSLVVVCWLPKNGSEFDPHQFCRQIH